MMFENVLCIIPARAGSKGIPNKNMKEVGGIPLVQYSIDQAQGAGIPNNNIYISSDGSEILDFATSCGVKTHLRPDEISGDSATTESALLDVVESEEFNHIDMVLLLQPTSPIRFKGRIKHAIETFISKPQYDSLVSTTKFYPFFWQERTVLTNPRYVSTFNPNNRPTRQTLDKEDLYYFENGNIYIVNKNALINERCRIGDNPLSYPITEIEGMQIDTPEELLIFNSIIEHVIDLEILNDTPEDSG
jgi:N-acylneuraminate cytidylyltransferase